MAAARVCWWRIKAGLAELAGALGGGESVVDFEDGAFGAVIAVELGFVFALHDGECVQDVGHGGAGRGEMGQGGGLLPPLGLRAEVKVEGGGGHINLRRKLA